MTRLFSLTIDFEHDWGGRTKTAYGIELMTDVVLEILGTAGSKATFFVSTETIEQTRARVRVIHQAGHEIASHGHHHFFHYDRLSREDLRFELSTSKAILEEITGVPVLGFRTPYFKKNRLTEEIEAELGYRYDSSSVSTSLKGRYSARQHEYNLVQEFPVSSLYSGVPAGVKWINLLGGTVAGPGMRVIYAHLFDLLSITEMVRLYHPAVSKKVALFYIFRRGQVVSTFKNVAEGSRPLGSFLTA